jgi:hypothetical protein
VERFCFDNYFIKALKKIFVFLKFFFWLYKPLRYCGAKLFNIRASSLDNSIEIEAIFSSRCLPGHSGCSEQGVPSALEHRVVQAISKIAINNQYINMVKVFAE